MNLADIVTNVKVTCQQNNINYSDFLLYAIYSEYPIGTLNADRPTFWKELFNQKRFMEDEYLTLCNTQSKLEDEDHAFAVQHAIDIYDVLLGRF